IDLSDCSNNSSEESILKEAKTMVLGDDINSPAEKILQKMNVPLDLEWKSKYFLFFTDIKKNEFFKFNKLHFICNVNINHSIINCGGGTGGLYADELDLMYSNNQNWGSCSPCFFIALKELLIPKE
ncbi:MAG: hypothetical protein RL708_1093, partial [Bacteroidota bacterium]